MHFFTKRFSLQVIKITDVNENYLNWFNDYQIRKYIESSSKKQSILTLKNYVKSKRKKSNVIFLSIFVKKNKKHIGNIKFEPVDTKKKITTMGIMIGDKNWRGKGVAKEVLLGCSEKLYFNYGILKILLGVEKKNIIALNAYKKIGFIEYKHSKKNKRSFIKMFFPTSPHHRISIGTAQFGEKYGITNTSNKTSLKDIKSIIKIAENKGIHNIDNAIAYGESDLYLGQADVRNWDVSTKIPPIPNNCSNLKNWLNKKFKESLIRLKLKKIDTLFLHNPNDLLSHNGKDIYRIILDFKSKGLIKKFGLSFYDIAEVNKFIPKFKIDAIQTPFNLIDRRLIRNQYISLLKDFNIEIHIRSIFLQGLLLIKPKSRPMKFNKWKKIWDNYDNWIHTLKIMPVEACIGYVKSFPEIDRIIIGFENKSQLIETLKVKKIINNAPFNISSCDENLINPYNWDNF